MFLTSENGKWSSAECRACCFVIHSQRTAFERAGTCWLNWMSKEYHSTQRGLFQARGCRRPDRPSKQCRHFHDAVPPTLSQVHHCREWPHVGQVGGSLIQERPSIVWAMTPEAKQEFVPVVRNRPCTQLWGR